MDGTALLIVPAATNGTDPWVDPSGWSRYYSEAQFAPAQIQLQTVANAYVNGDAFNLSRAANQLRQNFFALSPSIYPRERQLRLEYFHNHFKGFAGPPSAGASRPPLSAGKRIEVNVSLTQDLACNFRDSFRSGSFYCLLWS